MPSASVTTCSTDSADRRTRHLPGADPRPMSLALLRLATSPSASAAYGRASRDCTPTAPPSARCLRRGLPGTLSQRWKAAGRPGLSSWQSGVERAEDRGRAGKVARRRRVAGHTHLFSAGRGASPYLFLRNPTAVATIPSTTPKVWTYSHLRYLSPCMAVSPAIISPVARTFGQSIFIPPGWATARAYRAITDSAAGAFIEVWSAATLSASPLTPLTFLSPPWRWPCTAAAEPG
jgi:hypothetical protein